MELELKDLVHYLPYKLKCQWHNGDVGILTQLHVCEKDTPYFGDFVMFVTADAAMTIESEMPAGCHQIKPVLRRIKDITIEEAAWFLQQTYFPHVNYPITDFKLTLVGKEESPENPRISIDNDWYTHQLTFGNKQGAIWASGDNDRAWNTKLTPEIFNKLYELHFDVFGLIEQGLAIDINSL